MTANIWIVLTVLSGCLAIAFAAGFLTLRRKLRLLTSDRPAGNTPETTVHESDPDRHEIATAASGNENDEGCPDTNRLKETPILILAENSDSIKEYVTRNFGNSHAIVEIGDDLSKLTNALSKCHEVAITAITDSGPGKYGIEIPESQADRDFLSAFIKLVEDNIALESLDNRFIQDFFNMSASTLYRKVKNLTGTTTVDFIRQARLRKAVDNLERGCNISEAAFQSGYGDLGNFRAAFKDKYGMSPSQYIKGKKTDISEDNGI